MKLLRAYGSRWGHGHVHVPADNLRVPICNPHGVYAELVDGEPDEVTCRHCLAKLARQEAGA